MSVDPDIMPPPNADGSLPTAKGAVGSLVWGILGMFCLWLLGCIPAIIMGHKALGRIRRSQGTLGGEGLAIGGLITGYLGLITGFVMFFFFGGIIAAISLPAFSHARERAQEQQCLNNIRMIETVKDMYEVDHGGGDGGAIPDREWRTYVQEQFDEPIVCSKGGEYIIGKIGEKPRCTVHDDGGVGAHSTTLESSDY